MRYLVILVAVTVSGCGMNPEYAAEKRQERVDAAIAEMSRACSKIGHVVGSAEHKECVTRLLAAEAGKADVHVSQPAARPKTCTTYGNTTQCY